MLFTAQYVMHSRGRTVVTVDTRKPTKNKGCFVRSCMCAVYELHMRMRMMMMRMMIMMDSFLSPSLERRTKRMQQGGRGVRVRLYLAGREEGKQG